MVFRAQVGRNRQIEGQTGQSRRAKSNILIQASRDISMAEIRSVQPGGMAQKTNSPISRFRSFTSMTAKLLVGAIFMGTIGGCATSGYKLPKSYIRSDLEGKFKEKGSATSPAGTEIKYGTDGKGNEKVVVTDGKTGTSYTSTRKIKKVKYDKKTGQYKVSYTDGTVQYLPAAP